MFEITHGNIARIGAVVNKNLLLVRYSLERLAKSFKRAEL